MHLLGSKLVAHVILVRIMSEALSGLVDLYKIRLVFETYQEKLNQGLMIRYDGKESFCGYRFLSNRG